MRNLMMIVLIIGAVIVACLYLLRVHTVPADVKESLETGQGAPIHRMTQVPEAVRKKLEQANRTADSSMGDAMRRSQDTDK